MDDSTPPTINRLRLVPDQPVEGCELAPDVFLMNGIAPQNAWLEFHWYRSTEKMACSWCGKTPVAMQRLTDNSYYCSVPCFVAAWPGHAAQHRTGLTQRGPRNDEASARIESSSERAFALTIRRREGPGDAALEYPRAGSRAAWIWRAAATFQHSARK